ncbi:NADH dehydrogenase 1 alpha subcomplex assembly factor [Dorcoceras hygrometricum]|uniref:NADH dehydrogenase 1 alpha subcomplex assembly factor n=1 Tax=Dorcoceras hygrometricum TaxID=472368 RepID=A0A2Z7CVI6_9LAMI|nr:NADH dehydrogenase 1 alpha subcomplex assembly factor [Dorcoceras hygrometricum]
MGQSSENDKLEGIYKIKYKFQDLPLLSKGLAGLRLTPSIRNEVVDLQLNLRFSRIIQDGGLFQSQLINIEDGVAGSSSLPDLLLQSEWSRNGLSLRLPIASSPFRSTVDPSVQRFGLLWKLYMKAQKRRTLPF